MFEKGFGIYNLQWLMCHKTKQNKTKPNKKKPIQPTYWLFRWIFLFTFLHSSDDYVFYSTETIWNLTSWNMTNISWR